MVPPAWRRRTRAFRSVSGGRATLATPKGSIEVGLEARPSLEWGTVDWIMTFPDGSVGRAFSRLVPLDHVLTLYSFVLLAPPVPLEQVEGALAEQAKVLRQEYSWPTLFLAIVVMTMLLNAMVSGDLNDNRIFFAVVLLPFVYERFQDLTLHRPGSGNPTERETCAG